MESFWEPLETLLEASGNPFGSFWKPPGTHFQALEASRSALEAIWLGLGPKGSVPNGELLGASGKPLGSFWKLLGSFWEALGKSSGSLWEALGKSSGSLWEASGSLWKASGKLFGKRLDASRQPVATPGSQEKLPEAQRSFWHYAPFKV